VASLPPAERTTTTEKTTIAIVSANTVVENALALLLEGVGYDTKILQESSAADAGEHLGDVNLLLTPSLSEEDKEAFLRTVEAAPAAGDVPVVLTLSRAPKEELNGQTSMVVPWPTPLEDIRRAIEAALAPAEGKG
jgi:hypothetical protein